MAKCWNLVIFRPCVNPVMKMIDNVAGVGASLILMLIYVFISKNAYGNLPLGAIPLPESKITTATLPKTRGKSVKELTGEHTVWFKSVVVFTFRSGTDFISLLILLL